MATGSQQFSEEYNRIKEVLRQHPQISLIEQNGQSTDRFEVEYLLQGYEKEENGSIVIVNTHRIEVEVPFGYPHFAPTVKPLTRIFHPDIDPDAVRIADFWQQTPSLAELILHIGYMISGDEYDLETPFNQEAADYYLQHHDSLPLDSVQPYGATADSDALFEDGDSFPPDGDALFEEDDSVLTDADSLFEEDVSVPTDADSLFEEDDSVPSDSSREELALTLAIEEPSTPGTVTATDDTSSMDLDPIHGLVADRKLFEAASLLDHMAQKGPLDAGAKELLKDIEQQQNKVEQLYSLAQELEDLGNAGEALEIVRTMFEIAVDTPGTEELRSRLEKAAGFMPPPPPKAGKKGKTKKAEAKKKRKPKTKKAKRSFSFPLSLPAGLPAALPVKTVIIFVSLVLLSATGSKLYFDDRQVITDADSSLAGARTLIDAGQLEQAVGLLEETRASLSSLTILRFKKSGIEDRITSLRSSPSFQKNSSEPVLYNGKEYPPDIAQALIRIDTLTATAQEFKGKGMNAEALLLYRQALELAQRKNLEQRRIALESTVGNIELEAILLQAGKAEVNRDWQQATETYSRALQLSNTLSDAQTAAQIASKLTAASFRMEFDESKKSFTREEWQTTISKLNHALQLINSNPDVVSEQEKRDLHKLLINARLYSMLSEAKDYYDRGEWDNAVETYNTALTLLKEERENFGAGESEEAITKITRTILMVRIAQVQEKVFTAEQNNDSAKIVEYSTKILQLIDTGNVPQDKTLKDIRSKVAQQLQTHRKKLVLDRKRQWLVDNYQGIFREHFPAFKGSELAAPTATFLKTEGRNTVFTVSCIEKSRGSSSRLELTYLHDGGNNTWRVHDE